MDWYEICKIYESLQSTLNILQAILKSLVSLETAKPLWMISNSNLEIFNIAVMILFFISNCQWYIIIMEFIKKITEFESTTHISCPPSVAFNCKVRQFKSSFRYACEIIRYLNACIDVHFHHRDCVCYHWNGAVWRYAFRGVLRILPYYLRWSVLWFFFAKRFILDLSHDSEYVSDFVLSKLLRFFESGRGILFCFVKIL